MIASSGTKVRSPMSTKRGSTSFGTFTRAKVSVRGDRVAQPDRDRERQVRDVGEGAAGADGERGEHGEDLLAEHPVDRLELLAGALVAVDHPDALLGQRGAHRVLPLADVALAQLARALDDPLDGLGRGEAVGPARVDAGVHLVVQAGHAAP